MIPSRRTGTGNQRAGLAKAPPVRYPAKRPWREVTKVAHYYLNRAEYGAALVGRPSADLTQRFGRGFSRQNLQQMRVFYLAYPPEQIRQTMSGESNQFSSQAIRQTPSGKSGNPPRRNLPPFPIGQPTDPAILQTLSGELGEDENLPAASAESWLTRIAPRFPLPWSAYVRLLSIKNETDAGGGVDDDARTPNPEHSP